jgi:hypothetical protein
LPDILAGGLAFGQIPAVYNIEIDPGEQHNIAEEHDFVENAGIKIYRQLVASMTKYPNTPSRAFSKCCKYQVDEGF